MPNRKRSPVPQRIWRSQYLGPQVLDGNDAKFGWRKFNIGGITDSVANDMFTVLALEPIAVGVVPTRGVH